MQAADIPTLQPTRPQITDYQDPSLFLKDMIEFRKRSEKGFSVLKACGGLRRTSPALVSLIIKGKRKITLDRLDELAKLMNLNSQEKFFFRNWLQGQGAHDAHEDLFTTKKIPSSSRHEVTTHILKDWLNVYVKDCFQIPKIQQKPQLIYKYLSAYASPQRIDKAIQFLLQEGHLRKTLDGRFVVEVNLAVADPKISSQKIRKFHKNAMSIARAALDIFPPTERYSNTLILPLNEKSYVEFVELIQNFARTLQDFAANDSETGDRLYQCVLNLSPAGGKID